MCLHARPGIWLDVADAAAWLQFRGAVETYLLASRAVHHYGGHREVSLVLPWAQKACRWYTPRVAHTMYGLVLD